MSQRQEVILLQNKIKMIIFKKITKMIERRNHCVIHYRRVFIPRVHYGADYLSWNKFIRQILVRAY